MSPCQAARPEAGLPVQVVCLEGSRGLCTGVGAESALPLPQSVGGGGGGC